jgi:hypothetical protein
MGWLVSKRYNRLQLYNGSIDKFPTDYYTYIHKSKDAVGYYSHGIFYFLFLIIIYHKTKSTALLLSLLCDKNNIPPRIKKRAITLPGDCSFFPINVIVRYLLIHCNASLRF